MQYTFLLLDLVQGVTLNVQNKIGQNRTTGSTLICIDSISSEVIIIVVYIRARGIKRKKMIKRRRKFYRGADFIKYIDPNEGEALRRGGESIGASRPDPGGGLKDIPAPPPSNLEGGGVPSLLPLFHRLCLGISLATTLIPWDVLWMALLSL